MNVPLSSTITICQPCHLGLRRNWLTSSVNDHDKANNWGVTFYRWSQSMASQSTKYNNLSYLVNRRTRFRSVISTMRIKQLWMFTLLNSRLLRPSTYINWTIVQRELSKWGITKRWYWIWSLMCLINHFQNTSARPILIDISLRITIKFRVTHWNHLSFRLV